MYKILRLSARGSCLVSEIWWVAEWILSLPHHFSLFSTRYLYIHWHRNGQKEPTKGKTLGHRWPLLDEDVRANHSSAHCVMITLHTAKKIQFMYYFSENCAVSVPNSKFMYLWAIYLFPGSVHIFGCRKIDRPILEICTYINLSQIYDCMNWERDQYNSVLEI